MPLPADFTFTQSNLQDYVECPRRFELRYIRQLQYPAIEAEPILDREKHMQQGAAFHHMVHQHHLGVPEDILNTIAHEEPLRSWWANYLAEGLSGLPDQRHAEIGLTAPLAEYRLLAKYDLIAINTGQKVVIVDWKTAQHRPKRTRLRARLQTIVYPYLLARAGAHLNNGTPIHPDQIEMVYWFADDPKNPERFAYDATQYAEAETYLTDLINEIVMREQFDLTTQEWRCKFCSYRSLCQRGVNAGHIDDLDRDQLVDSDPDGFDIDFDFDQIAEVEF